MYQAGLWERTAIAPNRNRPKQPCNTVYRFVGWLVRPAAVARVGGGHKEIVNREKPGASASRLILAEKKKMAEVRRNRTDRPQA